ncbi:hypothetical protein NIE88_09590 [Sporolactobacillus shoreicorticis]|uniref:Uncharacterized protein n=1 Tax=Sporolactobacillus shoreicorticis TaxID=1923877 RepID=A0ABW5S809_9BACL|nr:hypothetical protein [Sporolactobacillus shoreicorticis]MCO7126027.1 hypothetical protein [Sporolactobacillus shoreicorticis]
MNYRQIISIIISNINQTERNLNGLHKYGDEEVIEILTIQLWKVKFLVAALTDDSYDAIKKHLEEEK